ncbi:MAG: hypothetical protein LQ342_001919 [Letrouitia transgressa]|nr:MAG: hypothetical protein LQ342_001919 [Letrouitia transgressa]
MEYLKTDAGVPGFTTIFSSVTRPAEVDIMFVHGAYGSPINSFAGDCTAPALDGNEQEFWPSDRLPERLESLGVFPRVLTYGWRANAWLDSDTSISKLAGIFAQDIYEERSATPERPLVFIGHGLGGLLIKETISNMVMRGHQNGRREFCVRACFFFAVPQQGLDHPLNFAPLLARMACVLQKINPVGPYARMLASELEPRNKILIDLSREFAVTQRKHSISVFSFAESVKTQGHFVVPEKSAFCVTDPQNCYLLDANYRNIAALSRVEKNLETVLEHICGSITRYFPDRHL